RGLLGPVSRPGFSLPHCAQWLNQIAAGSFKFTGGSRAAPYKKGPIGRSTGPFSLSNQHQRRGVALASPYARVPSSQGHTREKGGGNPAPSGSCCKWAESRATDWNLRER